MFVSFFFALKAELEVLKFEFYQVKLGKNNGKTCWQNFGRDRLQFKFAFRIQSLTLPLAITASCTDDKEYILAY